MPQPTLSDVHVNVPLTNLSVAFFQESTAFVAGRVFPVVPVQKQSDRYYVYNRGDANRDDLAVRAPGTAANQTGYGLDNTPTYFANVWSLAHTIPDEIRANSDSVLSPDMDTTRFLTNKALIRRERIWVASYFVTSVWTKEYSGSTNASAYGSNTVQFWNLSTSTPIEDIRHMKQQVQLASGGYIPNKLTLGREVYDVLCDHPDIIDRLKAGQTPGGPAISTRVLMAAIFEVDEILVMDSVYNSAVEGATEVNTFIGGKNVLLSYAPAQPGLMVPSAGYTFAWTGLFGAGVEGNRIKSFRWEINSGDIVQIDSAFDMKKVSADCGGFFLAVIQ